MGIFDFFRKQHAERKHELNEPEQRGPSVHYVFAHYALRQLALAEPMRFLAILASPQAHDFLAAVLQDVAQQLGKPAPFAATDLLIHPTRIGDHPCAIVEFPTPQGITETYFTALLALVRLHEGLPADDESVPARYLTLEKGASFDNRPRTVLGEWTDTSHLNFGDGPTPTLYAFMQALERLAGGAEKRELE
jgi:hypothetical protein